MFDNGLCLEVSCSYICAYLMMKIHGTTFLSTNPWTNPAEQLIPKDLVGSQDGGSGKATDSQAQNDKTTVISKRVTPNDI